MVYRDGVKNCKVDPACPTEFLQLKNMGDNLQQAIEKWKADKSDDNFLDVVDAAKDLGVAWVNMELYVHGGKEFLALGHTLAHVGIQDEHKGRFAKSVIDRLDQKLAFHDLFLFRAKNWEKNN